MACALLLCGLHGTAPALGPRAPFVPPPPKPAASSSAAAEEVSVPAAGAAAAGLTGVRVGRPSMALIDGRWWALGSRPRNGVLLAVTAQGAWLRHADGRREWLPLVPVAGIAPIPPIAPTAPIARVAPVARVAATAPTASAWPSPPPHRP